MVYCEYSKEPSQRCLAETVLLSNNNMFWPRIKWDMLKNFGLAEVTVDQIRCFDVKKKESQD